MPIVATSFILHISSTGVFMPFFAQSIIMFPIACDTNYVRNLSVSAS